MTQTPTSEYDALNFDGTERRGNYRTVAYRIDILHICEGKDAAAILFEIIYRWQTEIRKPEILKEVERRKKANLPALTEEEVDAKMWVWMSYNDFVRECGGAVAYNTVIRMLDYLVETVQILECRENHDSRYADYEYRIRMDVVKEKLKALPATPAFLPKVPKKKEKKSGDSTQMGTPEKRSTQKGRRAHRSTQIGIDSTQKGRATPHLGTEVYPNGGTSHTTHIPSHIEHTDDTYAPESPTDVSASAVASATHTPSHSQDDDVLAGTAQGELNGHTHQHHRHPASQWDTLHDPGQRPQPPAETSQPDTETARLLAEAPGHAHGVDRGDQSAQSTTGRIAHAPQAANPPVEPAPSTLQGNSPRVTTRDENDYYSQFSTGGVDKSAAGSAKVEQQNELAPTKPASARTHKRASSKPAPPEFTDEGRKVWDAWCSLFKSPPPAAEKTITCANDLYARLMPWCQELHMTCKALLKDIKGWLFSTDPDWYRRTGVSLCDISTKFERWQSVKMEETERVNKPASKSPTTSTLEQLRQLRSNRMQGAMQ